MFPRELAQLTSMEYAPALAPEISDEVDPQNTSPFFSRLPAEIRQQIYEYTLSAYDDLGKPFDRNHHHYRPGYEYSPKYDFRLLETCKRVYFEARLLPISLNEIVLFLYRGPRGHAAVSFKHSWRLRYRAMNQDQCNAVQTVHFFAQQCYLQTCDTWLVPGSAYLVDSNDQEPIQIMSAKKFVLTFRHSDWWAWESPPNSGDQLGMCPWNASRSDLKQMLAEPLNGPEGPWLGWGDQFRHVKGLETLVIEFETADTKRFQLERVVDRAKHWNFPLNDQEILAWTGKLQESTWKGPAKPEEDNGRRPVWLRHVRPPIPKPEPPLCTKLVIKMTWQRAPRLMIQESSSVQAC